MVTLRPRKRSSDQSSHQVEFVVKLMLAIHCRNESRVLLCVQKNLLVTSIDLESKSTVITAPPSPDCCKLTAAVDWPEFLRRTYAALALVL